MSSIFRFKHFEIFQDDASLKVGTDAMILGAFCSNTKAKTALDIGTGTGVLAMMVAQTHPCLKIDAIDIDLVNCKMAKYNVEQSPFSDRIHVFQQDIFDFYPIKKYDLIFSNPPFHIASLKSDSDRISKSKHFTESEFENFIKKHAELLSETGLFFLIIPAENLTLIKKYLAINNLFLNEIIEVYAKPTVNNRLVVKGSKLESTLSVTEFLIRDFDGRYSGQYIEKTKCFHGTELT